MPWKPKSPAHVCEGFVERVNAVVASSAPPFKISGPVPNAAALPNERIPPEILTLERVLLLPLKTSVPCPALLSPEPFKAPESVAVANGLVTVTLRTATPKSTLPLNVMLFVARGPPNETLPPTATGFASVIALPADINTPPNIDSEPVPNAPLFPMSSAPELSVTPPLNELLPLTTTPPEPLSTSPAGARLPPMTF